MKIVMTSDTHEKHRQLEVPEGDIFIHAGDFSENINYRSVIEFNDWLGTVPCRHRIVVAGNHDFIMEKIPDTRKLFTNAIYLQDESIIIEGLKIYGSPWQPEFFNWAFNLPRGEALAQKWNLIPDDTDILVTHGPPMRIRDWVGRERVGDQDLLDRVKAVKPLIHVFGHIHAGAGYSQIDGTTYVNAAACDEAYRIKNNPTVIDLKRE
jgi:Icc-related predicted phosphoesterase